MIEPPKLVWLRRPNSCAIALGLRWLVASFLGLDRRRRGTRSIDSLLFVTCSFGPVRSLVPLEEALRTTSEAARGLDTDGAMLSGGANVLPASPSWLEIPRPVFHSVLGRYIESSVLGSEDERGPGADAGSAAFGVVGYSSLKIMFEASSMLIDIRSGKAKGDLQSDDGVVAVVALLPLQVCRYAAGGSYTSFSA